MNKISMSHQIGTKDEMRIIDKNQKLTLEVEKENKTIQVVVKRGIELILVILGKNCKLNVQIIEEENAKVEVSTFLEDSDYSFKADLNGRGAQVECSYSNISDSYQSNNHISIHHNSRKTDSRVYCNGFSINQAPITFDVNGYIEKNSGGCLCIQDSKIIELVDSNSKILPNLYIENYDVEASHAAYLGPFQKQELFYLASRGINRKEAITLLVKSLLLGKLKLEKEELSKVHEKIENYELVV